MIMTKHGRGDRGDFAQRERWERRQQRRREEREQAMAAINRIDLINWATLAEKTRKCVDGIVVSIKAMMLQIDAMRVPVDEVVLMHPNAARIESEEFPTRIGKKIMLIHPDDVGKFIEKRKGAES